MCMRQGSVPLVRSWEPPQEQPLVICRENDNAINPKWVGHDQCKGQRKYYIFTANSWCAIKEMKFVSCYQYFLFHSLYLEKHVFWGLKIGDGTVQENPIITWIDWLAVLHSDKVLLFGPSLLLFQSSLLLFGSSLLLFGSSWKAAGEETGFDSSAWDWARLHNVDFKSAC